MEKNSIYVGKVDCIRESYLILRQTHVLVHITCIVQLLMDNVIPVFRHILIRSVVNRIHEHDQHGVKPDLNTGWPTGRLLATH